MTLDEIRWIAKLFETRKMSKAAEELYVSQPALSQSLQRVEKQLGFSLFERFNKGLVPTEKGVMFYEMSQTITSTYDAFLAKAALADQAALRSVAIDMAPYLSSTICGDVLNALKAAHPEITFSIYEAIAGDMEDAIRRNKVQIVITNNPLLYADMVSYRVLEMDTVIFLRAGSDAKQFACEEGGKAYLDPIHLKDEPVVITSTRQTSHAIAENLFRECGIAPKCTQETQSILTLYKYAKAGICSSVGIKTPDVQKIDDENSLIYSVPTKYEWSKTWIVISASPEIDKRIPRDIYQILRKIVRGAYFQQEMKGMVQL